MTNTLLEQMENRRFKQGQVNFAKSSLSDPHIQKVIAVISKAKNVPVAEVEKYITEKANGLQEMAVKAPTLYGTLMQNVVEDQAFTTFWKAVPADFEIQGAPKFKERTFFKLIRWIEGEHRGRFWPLKSRVDKRRLKPAYEFVNGAGGKWGVTTAAATPSGTFIFNTDFMQKLLDYAHLKGIHPKGKKYVSNGGEIPDGYAYIEFLIMHEYMHYTDDDFYYQRIIPNANPKIINWVGDFRSNYTLVKSGYEQIPMGLFNDSINLDRQQEYIDMYNLVKSEFEKLKPEDQKKAEDDMNERGDDHEPGQEEGKESEGAPTDPMKDGKPTTEEMTKNSRKTEKEVGEGEDMSPEEREKAEKNAKPEDGKGDGDPDGKPGSGGSNSKAGEVDYNKIRPTFTWDQLVKRFLSTVSKRTEETYAKPARRGVGNVEMLNQMGAAPIKPAEIPVQTDAKLGFVFDCSASMNSVIGKVYSNAVNLLKQPQFRNSECYVLKYANGHEMFRVNFARNAAVQVADLKMKKRPAYNKTAAQVFTEKISGGTAFTAQMAQEIIGSLSDKWNVLIFVDSDNLWPGNYENFISVIKAKPNQVFVIFESRNTYIDFRQKFGGATPNISYFQ